MIAQERCSCHHDIITLDPRAASFRGTICFPRSRAPQSASCAQRVRWRDHLRLLAGQRMAHTAEPRPEGLQLLSKAVGPLPLLNRFVERIPAGDRRQKLAPAVGLGVLLRNILLSRRPLYGLAEWASRFEPALLGLPADATQYFNDDRIGRCLDALFRSNRAALMTEIVVRAVEEFELEMTELHNDSTTVTFTGQYVEANGKPVRGISTHRITYGVNKDFRPDLKQLLFILTTTADGAVP